MGTTRQASTLVMLLNRARRAQNKPPLTAEEEARERAHILAADLATVRGFFDKVNAELRFDRRTSPATEEQLGVLARWERRAYGSIRTTSAHGLSFEEAHARIESLKERAK